VLVVRLHPAILSKQRLPARLVSDRIWKERYEDIRGFERHLARNGTAIRKFFLNVSKDEQRKRFLARLDEPEKNWKFAAADVEERQHWDDYMKAYEDALEATSTEESPWYVIPADHKWFTRLAVADVIVEALEEIDPRFPEVSTAQREELARARALLEGGEVKTPEREDARRP
jgi:polyphosphate kinase 2 (PPK2 family)